jgi:tetratricopeptide (TPR) repeat protein
VARSLRVDRSRWASSPVDRSCLSASGCRLRLCLACLILVFAVAASLRCQATSTNAPMQNAESRSYYLKGMDLVRQGEIDDAIRVFEEGLSHNPSDSVMLDAAGAAYLAKGNTDQAKKYLLSSLRQNPGFVPARKNLAITYFTSGEYDLAATEFQKLAKAPGETRLIANLFLGLIQEKKGDYARAATLFAQSGALLYQYPDALLSFANSELQLNRTAKAEGTLKAISQMSGLSAAQHLRASQLYSQIGAGKNSLEEVEEAVEVDGHLEGLQYQRALALDQVGRSQESLAILKELAKENPDADALNLLSHVARENNEFSLALDSLREAARLAPEKEENYLDFSTFCADYGNNPLALQAAEVGLANIPKSYRLMVQKGVVLESLGRLNEAEEILNKAAAQQKDNSVALLSLAIVQTHASQLHDAENTLAAAIRKYPANYYMQYQLGVVLVAMQEGSGASAALQLGAKRAFREAIRLNPSFADSYYQLAKLYSTNSPKLEEQNLVACLRADPNHAGAEYKLARLYLKSGRQAEAQVLIDRFEGQRQTAKDKEMQNPRIESAPR